MIPYNWSEKTMILTLAVVPQMASLLRFIFFFIIFNLALSNGFGKLIYEEGYTVTTVFDGHKVNINPYSIIPRASSRDLLLLDSSNSLFYTLSLPLSQGLSKTVLLKTQGAKGPKPRREAQESAVKKFAGNGTHGFSDGSADSTMFDKPRSFALDSNGNVYVADRSNFAIRKISNSGVTTIAGGISKTAGHIDGPGRNATFSADYELTFVQDTCSLLILDHGHKLIRQIDLKAEDCRHSNHGVASTLTWPLVVGLAVSCLIVGLLVGFAIRPYIKRSEDFSLTNTESWMSYLMNPGSQTRTLCSGTRSVVASPAVKFLWRAVLMVRSHISLMLNLGITKVDCHSNSTTVIKTHTSLLDIDLSRNSEWSSSQKYFHQMRDLSSFDHDANASSSVVRGDVSKQDVSENGGHHGQVQDLMVANIASFAEDACQSTTVVEGTFLGVSTLVKRR